MKSQNITRRFVPLFVLAALVGGAFGAVQAIAQESSGGREYKPDNYLDHVAFERSGLFGGSPDDEVSIRVLTSLQAERAFFTEKVCVDAMGLSEEERIGGMQELMGIERAIALVEAEMLEPMGFAPRYICDHDGRTVMAAYTDGRVVAWEVEWGEDGVPSRYVRFQDVNAVASESDWFIYHSSSLDRFAVVSEYGDAGVVWWATTALDHIAHASDVVEQCRTYDHEDGMVRECGREFVK